jgi:NAD(P)-dependent dehydrogenase (short-subunit alcohol dehydrogenase family)
MAQENGCIININFSNPSGFGSRKAGDGMVSMPRTGESIEIASIALFTASDASSFVNGTVKKADAGYTAY